MRSVSHRSLVHSLSPFIHFMGSKLMVELLRRGKTGNDILKILDAVTGESSKLGVEEKEMILNSLNDESLSF